MATITACLIAKNEEKRLGKCLSSIRDIVDQIIVVDTGSTDDTKEVAKCYNAEVYDHEWQYDFAAARNESFSHATSDWIIWLDCDDYFKEKDRQEFKKLKEEVLDDTKYDVFDFWYAYRHDPETGVCTYKFQRDRLIRNHKGFHWDYPVHEALLITGASGVYMTNIEVTHTSNHDNGEKYINFFEYKIENQNYQLRQRDMYYYGGELSIFGYYDKSQAVLEKFFEMGEHDCAYEAKRAAEYLFNIYIRKGMYLKAYEYELIYLKYGFPDPKIFWKLAWTAGKLNRKDEEIFYYKTNVLMKDNFIEDYSVQNDYAETFFDSALQLVCLLYYRGQYDEAKKYHKICKELNPENSNVKFNERFFKDEDE